jgi:hypothetical protein
VSARKHRLAECNPQWIIFHGKEGDSPDAVYFDCPEAHEDCRRVIPFTPALDGTSRVSNERVVWQRTGGDTFETLSLAPSIRGIPSHANRESALAAGCLEEYLTDSMFCALHIFITNGAIEFCGDSK